MIEEEDVVVRSMLVDGRLLCLLMCARAAAPLSCMIDDDDADDSF
jgi:hypothetical protein